MEIYGKQYLHDLHHISTPHFSFFNIPEFSGLNINSVVTASNFKGKLVKTYCITIRFKPTPEKVNDTKIAPTCSLIFSFNFLFSVPFFTIPRVLSKSDL